MVRYFHFLLILLSLGWSEKGRAADDAQKAKASLVLPEQKVQTPFQKKRTRLYLQQIHCEDAKKETLLRALYKSVDAKKCTAGYVYPKGSFALLFDEPPHSLDDDAPWMPPLRACMRERGLDVSSCSAVFSSTPSKATRPSHLYVLDVKCPNQAAADVLRSDFSEPVDLEKCSANHSILWRTHWLNLAEEHDSSKPWRRPLVECLQERNYNFSFCQVQLTVDARSRAERTLPKSPLVDCTLQGNAVKMQCQIRASTREIGDGVDAGVELRVDGGSKKERPNAK